MILYMPQKNIKKVYMNLVLKINYSFSMKKQAAENDVSSCTMEIYTHQRQMFKITVLIFF